MDVDDAVRGCEIAIVLVDHDEFKMVPLPERRHFDVIGPPRDLADMPART